METIKIKSSQVIDIISASKHDLPVPEGVTEEDWEKYLDEFGNGIAKAFRIGRVKIQVNVDDPFYEYFKLSKGKDKFNIGLGALQSKQDVIGLISVMKSLDDVISAANGMYKGRKKAGDIFYSDIHREVKSLFPSNQQSRSIAHTIIVDILKNRGLKVVS